MVSENETDEENDSDQERDIVNALHVEYRQSNVGKSSQGTISNPKITVDGIFGLGIISEFIAALLPCFEIKNRNCTMTQEDRYVAFLVTVLATMARRFHASCNTDTVLKDYKTAFNEHTTKGYFSRRRSVQCRGRFGGSCKEFDIVDALSYPSTLIGKLIASAVGFPPDDPRLMDASKSFIHEHFQVFPLALLNVTMQPYTWQKVIPTGACTLPEAHQNDSGRLKSARCLIQFNMARKAEIQKVR